MTNEVLNTLLARRSTKAFTDEKISDETLETILNAGLFAANGMGKQATISVVITKKELRDKLSKMNADILNANVDPFYGAPIVVIVLADSSVLTYVEDGSLVIGNMLLAAESLGVGACWIHRARQMFESAEGKELLKKWHIDEKYVGIGCCVLGYPKENAKRAVAPRREGRIVKGD